jgi:hypothetical protein
MANVLTGTSVRESRSGTNKSGIGRNPRIPEKSAGRAALPAAAGRSPTEIPGYPRRRHRTDKAIFDNPQADFSPKNATGRVRSPGRLTIKTDPLQSLVPVQGPFIEGTIVRDARIKETPVMAQELNEGNFQMEVLDAEVPVLVDFWSPT